MPFTLGSRRGICPLAAEYSREPRDRRLSLGPRWGPWLARPPFRYFSSRRNVANFPPAVRFNSGVYGFPMKVQILLDNAVIATQVVSLEGLSPRPSLNDVKRIALKAALEDKTIRISESLRATFRLFEPNGDPIPEEGPKFRSAKGFER